MELRVHLRALVAEELDGFVCLLRTAVSVEEGEGRVRAAAFVCLFGFRRLRAVVQGVLGVGALWTLGLVDCVIFEEALLT